ncbi:hypothetical protein CDAR_38351 [Caerostris darwini]|uniref:Transmembrane protein n=1 Tax=Caerostris darwini TaxID=1538125 RepID=A0AAV4N5B9_9ARAC|nr:hypothetical protein CDAR_38351 [Caerostris darwini]
MNQEVLDEWGVEEDCPRNGPTNGWFNIVAWIHGFLLCVAVSIQRGGCCLPGVGSFPAISLIECSNCVVNIFGCVLGDAGAFLIEALDSRV